MASDSPETPNSKHITIPLIGLQVERRTDLLAAAAFVLALASGIAQLYYGWVGARVEAFPPEQITLVLHDYGNGQRFLRVGARLAYVNSGRPGYNATIRREEVEFDLGARTYTQTWQSIHRLYSRGHQLQEEYVAEARPFPINAGSSVSREVYFAPHPERCSSRDVNCDSFRQFLEAGEAINLISGLETLEFRFRGWEYGKDQPLTVTCTVDVSDITDRLLFNGWAAPPCWPTQS